MKNRLDWLYRMLDVEKKSIELLLFKLPSLSFSAWLCLSTSLHYQRSIFSNNPMTPSCHLFMPGPIMAVQPVWLCSKFSTMSPLPHHIQYLQVVDQECDSWEEHLGTSTSNGEETQICMSVSTYCLCTCCNFPTNKTRLKSFMNGEGHIVSPGNISEVTVIHTVKKQSNCQGQFFSIHWRLSVPRPSQNNSTVQSSLIVWWFTAHQTQSHVWLHIYILSSCCFALAASPPHVTTHKHIPMTTWRSLVSSLYYYYSYLQYFYCSYLINNAIKWSCVQI